jgi:hypothetical protein
MILGAENLSRIKLFTEVGELRRKARLVGERFICSEAEL